MTSQSINFHDVRASADCMTDNRKQKTNKNSDSPAATKERTPPRELASYQSRLPCEDVEKLALFSFGGFGHYSCVCLWRIQPCLEDGCVCKCSSTLRLLDGDPVDSQCFSLFSGTSHTLTSRLKDRLAAPLRW